MKVESMSSFALDMMQGEDQQTEKSDVFDQMLDTVLDMNQTQVTANNKMQQVLTGESDDTHGALIALEESELQMQMAVTTRDKLIQGYQQIINMQI